MSEERRPLLQYQCNMQEEPGIAISLTTPLEPVQNLQKTLQEKAK